MSMVIKTADEELIFELGRLTYENKRLRYEIERLQAELDALKTRDNDNGNPA